MVQIVPLQAVPSQKVRTILDQQTVDLAVYQRRYGMFIDVSVNGTLLIGAVICENVNRIIRNAYLNMAVGFAGDFVFQDTQGSSDPTYDGLGARYRLLYLTPTDLAALGFAT